jgi:hypothetical protein
MIGTIVDAHENSRGLWFKAELTKDDDFVRGRIIPQFKGREVLISLHKLTAPVSNGGAFS